MTEQEIEQAVLDRDWGRVPAAVEQMIERFIKKTGERYGPASAEFLAAFDALQALGRWDRVPSATLAALSEWGTGQRSSAALIAAFRSEAD